MIGLVGLAHCISHFSQLLLAPLFPWLKDAFEVSYAQLGFLLTIFFVVSCAVQAVVGLLGRPLRAAADAVRRAGAAGHGRAGLCGQHAATRCWPLFSVVAGIGNGVFHPVDYSLLNRKVASSAWAMPTACTASPAAWAGRWRRRCWCRSRWPTSWRVALVCAAALVFAVLVVLWFNRAQLTLPRLGGAARSGLSRRSRAEGSLDFLKHPRGVDVLRASSSSTPARCRSCRASRRSPRASCTQVPVHLAAICLTVYMVSAAAGMVLGGFLASDPARCERIVGVAFGLAALLRAGHRFHRRARLVGAGAVRCDGLRLGHGRAVARPAGQGRAPDNATGRVYGVVYAGLDIGQAVVPLVIGTLMDHGAYRSVWLALALLQGVLIVNAFNVRKARRTALQPAVA